MKLTETFEWNGREIAWGRAGVGPAVVLCHGTPFSSRVWSRYAEAFASKYAVYLWDMPGYGESSKHAEHVVDFGAQGEAFAALLGHWGLDRPQVIAHDFGGAVALRAMLRHGCAFGSLMLVDVVAIPPSGSPFFKFVQSHPDVLGELPGYIHEAVVRAYIVGAAHHRLAAERLEELVAPWLGPDGQSAFYRQIAQYDESYLVDNEARLGQARLPTHVVWAENDAWIPVDTGRRLAGLLPNARFTTVPDAGHLIQYDAPVALTSLVSAWLDTHAG
ncbi:alpha/beta fold hydrolase [Nocardia sp. CDC160]|uniref:alpha/beta fold hydrolase n=1 Tax=Nocardia sp. CDC160 TaxID=3112166 RepID=UPI002DB74A2D|nr:alpha/beta hydrolase [Nocardia sp. CDC160]MEC3918141.1 alpha/beta hydrolase [Nocardia sp. CDC160]